MNRILVTKLNMRNVIWLATAMMLALNLPAGGQQPVAMRIPAPELAGIESWINSEPLKLNQLRGKVVVLHFWTFG
jgi:hypothetical protein